MAKTILSDKQIKILEVASQDSALCQSFYLIRQRDLVEKLLIESC